MMEKRWNTCGGNINGCWGTSKKKLETLSRAKKILGDVKKQLRVDNEGKKTSKRCREM